ncbi:hypothetical protein ACFSY7_08325 [Kurthia populi]|uniref:Uncharacterized protein n=1 Tax=Kurthia populi TaxID=1562132 RepID=A0ABW5Y059_9BACL
MTEKLKVSREVADAIEYLGKVGCAFEEAMESHVSTGWSNFSDERVIALGGLTSKELATALIVGYEVEMTPHERIMKAYNAAKRTKNGSFASCYHSGVMAGITTALDTLGIKIKGVNDK